MTVTSTRGFLDQLEERARSAGTLLCIGLDPHGDLLPGGITTAAEARDLCFRLIDATADLACAFKPNSAFFEVFGAEGFEALKQVIAHVPPEIPVILDAKRGDIASTADAYAKAAFETLGTTAITLSPYLGRDSVQPFLERPGKGAFILCKTSNPGADDFQALPVQGAPLYEAVAQRVQTWNTHNNVGLVVGATDVQALARVRSVAPDAWFLVPGIGAQGGELDAALKAGLRADGLGMLINVSRSVAKAPDPRAEAMRLRDAIQSISAQPRPSAVGPVDDLARALASSGCVRFGSFTLKSGKQSPIYLDLRRLVSYPRALQTVATALNRLLATLTFDHIAGIPYAALPIATAAALQSEHSMIYPRREAKDYGTKASIEGVFAEGETAVVVDDLATTGETKFETIDRLKAAGLHIRDIVVVIDRKQGAADTLARAGYHFHAVATLHQLLDAWQRQGTLSAEQRREVDEYLTQQVS